MCPGWQPSSLSFPGPESSLYLGQRWPPWPAGLLSWPPPLVQALLPLNAVQQPFCGSSQRTEAVLMRRERLLCLLFPGIPDCPGVARGSTRNGCTKPVTPPGCGRVPERPSQDGGRAGGNPGCRCDSPAATYERCVFIATYIYTKLYRNIQAYTQSSIKNVHCLHLFSGHYYYSHHVTTVDRNNRVMEVPKMVGRFEARKAGNVSKPFYCFVPSAPFRHLRWKSEQGIISTYTRESAI